MSARSEALTKGEKFYEGRPHKCGTTTKYSIWGGCVHCNTAVGISQDAKQRNREAGARYRRKIGKAERDPDVISRKNLPSRTKRQITIFKAKLKKYWPNLPVAERYAEFNRLVIEQAGRCGVCAVALTGKHLESSELCVDHCYTTGRVRGLLCRHCNRSMHRDLTLDIWSAVGDYLKKVA